jgi:hypothetical protein
MENPPVKVSLRTTALMARNELNTPEQRLCGFTWSNYVTGFTRFVGWSAKEGKNLVNLRKS